MRKYEEAMERAKQGLPIDEVFPELKESEDERIRNEILLYIGSKQDIDLDTHNRWCAYLEKHKEQKSAEWSEENKHCTHQLILFCENCMQQDSEAIRCATWLKSLRPSPHWKPSEEQMIALKRSIGYLADYGTSDDDLVLDTLYNDLKKL